ncbi:ComEA family DNA-binding protein [Glycomyces arizonensis]|uniref:ComEA family DNA-binding protein n=1 Tax=Glycomyces arizonensis TaxID=256035 RepID=UPI00042A53F4|nr:helix-hairpin-helix domain-containing protein [Glycomyces arizonensis]
MTVPGPVVPYQAKRSKTAAEIGTILWAMLPILTCGIGVAIAFGVAVAKRRTPFTIASLVVYSALSLTWICLAGTFGAEAPLWADVVVYAILPIVTLVATVHLFVIRPLVWAPRPVPTVLVARPNGPQVVDRARQLRHQARGMVAADPMLARRLAIGRPDLPRQFDDGGLVDLNHAPVHVLTSLPGVTEASARQIRDRVERSGPFESLGEVLLVVEISPTFEHHLREYVVFIP